MKLSEKIAEEVKTMIKKNNMKPGDKLLSEEKLGEVFNVSRPTIREAMQLLKAENIVEIERGRGTFISEHTGVIKDPLGLEFVYDSSLVKDLLEARLIIEPPITFLAATRTVEKSIRDLGEIIKEMKLQTTQDESTADLDMKFHTLIAKCTGNNVLHRVVPIINESIVKGHDKTYGNNESLKRAIESHVNIFNAIKSRQPLVARYEAEKHIRQTLDDIK